MHTMRDLLTRLSRRSEEPPDGVASHVSHVDRERLEGHFGDWKEDVHTAAGDGVVFPTLPETTPEGLYEEFEHDEEPPADLAP